MNPEIIHDKTWSIKVRRIGNHECSGGSTELGLNLEGLLLPWGHTLELPEL